MVHELKQASDRVHFLIAELRQDGISEAAILGALGQAVSEVAANINRTPSFLRGCASDIETMMLKRAG